MKHSLSHCCSWPTRVIVIHTRRSIQKYVRYVFYTYKNTAKQVHKQPSSWQKHRLLISSLAKLPTLGRVHQCLDPTMPQKWSDLFLPMDPWTGWKLTPMDEGDNDIQYQSIDQFISQLCTVSQWQNIHLRAQSAHVTADYQWSRRLSKPDAPYVCTVYCSTVLYSVCVCVCVCVVMQMNGACYKHNAWLMAGTSCSERHGIILRHLSTT